MKFSPDFLLTLAQSLGWMLMHSLWQGALIGCALLMVLRLLVRRSAALRHTACMAAMATLLLLSIVTMLRAQPAGGGAALEAAAPLGELKGGVFNAPAPVPLVPLVKPDAPAGMVHRAGRSPLPPALSLQESLERVVPWMAAVWLLGISLLSMRRVFAWRTLHGWKKRGTTARPELQERFARLARRLGIQSGVTLLESAEVAAPMLVGIFRPAVLLPLRVVTGLSGQEMEAVLVHELAHFVRRDAWFNLAQVAVETLFFYHPVVWWMGRCAREEREHAADDLAVRLCGDRRAYAGALSHLAEFNLEQTTAVAANGGTLLARIRRILRPSEVEILPSGWSVGVPTLICLVGIALLVRGEAQNVKPAEATKSPQATAAPTLEDLRTKAYRNAKPWVDDAFQLDDTAKRQAAIEQIRKAITSGNPDEVRAGIIGFMQIGPIEFDKVSFRPAVRALLTSPDPLTRSTAASALTITGADPEDVVKVLAMAEDPAPEVRSELSWVIMRLHGGDLTGPGGDAVVKLLSSNDRNQLREGLRGIWGAKFSPALEARVIELSRNFEGTGSIGYDAMYFALSTQSNKSEASVKRLIELLANPDTTNVAGRCAWGLQMGVSKEQFGLVANAMVKVLDARSEGYLRDNALRNLEQYGGPEQAPALRALLAKPGVTGPFRKSLENMLAAWEKTAMPEKTPPPAASKKEPVTLGEKVDALEEKVMAIQEQKSRETQLAELLNKNRQLARLRANQDLKRYTSEQLNEIETLYQVANKKGVRNEEARESLRQLLERYDSANRTGCALLYLGQGSEGEQRLDYLTRAVEKFSDCYYFNGCQVGGYGRYVLALTLWEKGEKEKARKLFEEIKTTYKDAIDHRGRPMPELVEAAEKELAKQQ